MYKDGQRCTDLIKLTANSLSGDVVALMLIAVQKDNLELSVTFAISWWVLLDTVVIYEWWGIYPI